MLSWVIGCLDFRPLGLETPVRKSVNRPWIICSCPRALPLGWFIGLWPLVAEKRLTARIYSDDCFRFSLSGFPYFSNFPQPSGWQKNRLPSFARGVVKMPSLHNRFRIALPDLQTSQMDLWIGRFNPICNSKLTFLPRNEPMKFVDPSVHSPNGRRLGPTYRCA